jgi:hypothetical protein
MMSSIVAETIGLNQSKGTLEESFSVGRAKRGLELKSMRERTELSSGSFPIESEKGLGPILK